MVAALVNPAGVDHGEETVTLLNSGMENVNLAGWSLVDKMGNRFALQDVDLGGGMAMTILLPKNSIQLSNKGGEIRIVDRGGHTAHVVTYSKKQALDEGRTIIF